jgi:hypothetical protein
MALPQYDGDLPPYRCTREAGADRKDTTADLHNGRQRYRRVCEAHTRSLRIRFYDENDDDAAVA